MKQQIEQIFPYFCIKLLSYACLLRLSHVEPGGQIAVAEQSNKSGKNVARLGTRSEKVQLRGIYFAVECVLS